MPTIGEFTIIEPPTSEELRQLVAESVAGSTGVLRVVLLGQQEIPTPQPQAVKFTVGLKTSRQISGLNEAGHDITVRYASDPNQPATASMTIE